MDMLVLFQESYFTVFNYSGDKSEFAVMELHSQEFDGFYICVISFWVKKLGLKPEEIGLNLRVFIKIIIPFPDIL